MKRLLLLTTLGLMALSATAQQLVGNSQQLTVSSQPLNANSEERLIEHINLTHPGVIKEKGLTPEQAAVAARSAAEYRLKAPYVGPSSNQQFWFVMPQGTLLGYKRGVHYVTGNDPTIRLLAEDLTDNMTARFNGALVDGKFHTITADLDWVSYGLVIARDRIYDPANNWQLYLSVDISDAYYLISQEVAVDPITHRVYGTFLRDDYYTYDIAWVNYTTKEIHRIGPAQRDYPGLGMNSEGRLFGIDMDGVLYEISTVDGTDRPIGSTGIVVRDEDNRYFMQSAECSVSDNVLYWAAVLPDGSSALYAVDLATAEATKLYDLPQYTLAHCLTVPDTMADDEAPAAITDLKATFEGASTTGTLTLTMPATTYSGQPLSGNLDYSVRIDGTETNTGSAASGAQVNVGLTLAEGLHFVEVFASNGAGRSPQAALHVFVGLDEPGQVQQARLQVADDVATLSWQPTRGINGGYAGDLTYTVKRYPDGVVVASNITATSFTDQVPLGEWQSVSYGITASNGTLTGSEVRTNSCAMGQAYEVPYTEDFLTRDDFINNYTIYDANGDGVSWVTNISQNSSYVIYTFNISTRWTNVPADDWLFTPTYTLKGGKRYRLSFVEACYGETNYENKVEVKLGKGAYAEAMTTELIPVRVYNNNQYFQKPVVEFTAPEDGNFNVGFHVVSDQRRTDFIIDLVELEEASTNASPAAPTDVEVVAAAQGALAATVSLTAPTKTLDGSDLTSLTKVRVMRQNRVVHTFDNPEPGQRLSFTDPAAVNGFNTYTVVATNDVSDGPFAQATSYVGIDIPSFDFASVGVEDNGDHITVKWAQVGNTGLNGGYVNPAAVAYGVYRVEYDIESGLMTADNMIDVAMGTDHLDIMTPTDQGEQSVVSYAIVAFNEVGADQNHTGATYGMPIGQPYPLPFIQSASNSKLGNKMMWVETGNTTSPTYAFTTESYDKDNGSFGWSPTDPANSMSLNTGKISLAGANNPTLRFAHKCDTRSRFMLKVLVQTPDREETELLSVDYRSVTGTSAHWTLESVDLSDFKNEEYIVVKFVISTTATTASQIKGKTFLIDAINVLDSQPYNLSIDIDAPEGIVAGSGDNINMVVHNVGEKDAQGYTVTLLVDGEEVYSETVNEALPSLNQKTVSYNYRPSVFGTNDRVTARAELSWLFDLVDEDNEMEEDIAILQPVVQQPREAYAYADGDARNLTWGAPERVAQQVNESFEGPEYTDFDLGGITTEVREGMLGDWTMWNLDGDGTWEGPHGPTGHLPDFDDTQLDGVTFPNMNQVCAWLVFNEDKVVGTIGGKSAGSISAGNTPITPRTGKKMAATFDDFVKQDTWLISPELSGRAQDVTFYAAAPATQDIIDFTTGATKPDQVEVLEILVSMGGLSVDDFESLGTDTIITQEWHDYEIELDEGTKYFAIRNVSPSYNAMALFVDDATFERLSPLPASYNIYGDEQFIANVALGTAFKVDGRASQYAVTAVYANGDESLPVVFVDGTQGIADVQRQSVATRVYDLQGRRVVSPRSALKRGVYIVNGKTVILR